MLTAPVMTGIKDKVEQAVRELFPLGVPPAVASQAQDRPRPMWPMSRPVSVVAYVFCSQMSLQTKICALGVGSQYDRPATAAMQQGTALHRILSQHVGARLASAGFEPQAERWIENLGLTGKLDLAMFVENTPVAIEFKTSSAGAQRTMGLSLYEETQTGLYIAMINGPVLMVFVTLPNFVHALWRTEMSQPAREALILLKEYQAVAPGRPTPPYGDCASCVYSKTCLAKEHFLCPHCLRPVIVSECVQLAVPQRSLPLYLHYCGHVIGRRQDGGLCSVNVRGGKVINVTK